MRVPISMEWDDLETLRQMREMQRRYFDGDKSVIGRCKALERKADQILARYPRPNETNLFSPDSEIEPEAGGVLVGAGAEREESDDPCQPPNWWAGLTE